MGKLKKAKKAYKKTRDKLSGMHHADHRKYSTRKKLLSLKEEVENLKLEKKVKEETGLSLSTIRAILNKK